ncbi:hypothetical protein K9M79_03320, partial [Candidatus Woesearchaeota archaeon]|nr:hypothetical protein [Candidatus Woesearchaeota archaeon]
KTLTDYIESDASGNIGIGDVTAEDPSTKLDLYTGDLRVRDMAGCSGRLITDEWGVVQCNTDAVLTTETDPEVGDVSTADLWCRSDGDSVECDQAMPSISETDPRVPTCAQDQILVYDSGSWACDDPGSAAADNLGDHVMTQNLQTDGNHISNDGDSEGISIGSTGNVIIAGASGVNSILSIISSSSSEYSAIDFYGSVNNFWGLGRDPSDNFYLDRSGVGRVVTINPTTQYLAIGTQTPSAKLDLDGSARFRTYTDCDPLKTDSEGNFVCGTGSTLLPTCAQDEMLVYDSGSWTCASSISSLQSQINSLQSQIDSLNYELNFLGGVHVPPENSNPDYFVFDYAQTYSFSGYTPPGTPSDYLWTRADEFCKNSTRHFMDDWRLPSEAEFKLVSDNLDLMYLKYGEIYPEQLKKTSPEWYPLNSNAIRMKCNGYDSGTMTNNCVAEAATVDLSGFYYYGSKAMCVRTDT